MRLTIEKVLLLKSLDMFSGIPDEILAELSEILEEMYVVENELIVKQGEIGHSLYIITEGEVRVHDGESTLKTASNGEAFGELAVFSPEPWNHSLTAIKETQLVRLDQEALHEFMIEYVEVAIGILKVFSEQLRDS